jgi:GLPGLI family protein
MKHLLLPAMLLVTLSAFSQMKEGKIIYERVFQLPVRTFNVDPAIAAQIPKSRTDQYELLFANNQSLWQYLPSAANDADGNTVAGGGMVFRFNAGNNDVSYCNFEKGTKIDQREIAEKSYVVTDSIRKQVWKLTDETKTILNYPVRKATSTRVSTRMQMSMENGIMKRDPVQDTSAVVAWFTTDIPVSVGPEFQGQLPGAILELDIANGQTVYKALEVSPKVSVSKIKEPKDGKKMSAEQFAKEREKVMEEMRRNMPSGNVIRIQQ